MLITIVITFDWRDNNRYRCYSHDIRKCYRCYHLVFVLITVITIVIMLGDNNCYHINLLLTFVITINDNFCYHDD